MSKLVEFMRGELERLEAQRKQAKETLAEIENTISEIKESTGYQICNMMEKENINEVKKIWPKHDGTHIIFNDKEISAGLLNKFKKFKLEKLYSDNNNIIAVFE